jgi:hypothetical protein
MLAASKLSSTNCGQPQRATTGMSFNDPGHGWPNRPTWALDFWLHGDKYCYRRDAAIATRLAHQNTFNPSGKPNQQSPRQADVSAH